MKPPPFSYAAPTTLAEAVGLLTEHAEAEPRVLAGGQSLIPLMNFRLAKPGYLIDLRHVAGLSGIRREGDTLVIGAMTTDVGGGAVGRGGRGRAAAGRGGRARRAHPGAQPRHGRRQPGARRPRGRTAHGGPGLRRGAGRGRPGRIPRAAGRGVHHRTVQHRAGPGRDPHRDPAAGVARRARVRRVLPDPRELRRGRRGRARRPRRQPDPAGRPGAGRRRPDRDPRHRGRTGAGRRGRRGCDGGRRRGRRRRALRA